MKELAIAVGFDELTQQIHHHELFQLRMASRRSTLDQEARRVEERIRQEYPGAKYLRSSKDANNQISLIEPELFIALGLTGELCVAHMVAHALSKNISVLAPTDMILMSGLDLSFIEAIDEIIHFHYPGTKYESQFKQKNQTYYFNPTS